MTVAGQAAGGFGTSSRYTVDVAYPSTFVFGQTPLQMRLAAAIAGAPPGPLTGPFAYCDLGCGNGNTLNTLASMYPQASFIGTDFNAAHLAHAREQASRAELGNVTYLEASFADLQALGIPAQDYIAIQGVYSWVSRAMRNTIQAFVRDRLNPGGLVCVQYGCLPGSTVHDPLFYYLGKLAARASGNTRERFAAAVSALQTLAPVSNFFASNAAAERLIQGFSEHPFGVVAHDVLNHQPHSFYFEELCEIQAQSGLEFVGSSPLKQNFPEFWMSKPVHGAYLELVNGKDVFFRHTMKDLILNTSRRTDVFRKPGQAAAEHTGETGLRSIGELCLYRIGGRNDLADRQKLASTCAADPASSLHTAVLDAAQAPRTTIAAVLDAPALKAFEPAAVEHALQQLVASGFLKVLVQPENRDECRNGGHYRMAARLNSMLLEEQIAARGAVGLASPVLGTVVMLPMNIRVSLLAFLGGDIDRVWQALQEPGNGISDGRSPPLPPREEFRAAIESSLPAFAVNAVPELVRLGVLEAVS